MSQETYLPNELKYILLEFNRLENSREEKNIKPETINEWIASFADEGFSAEHVCRMIRAVKNKCISYKLKFADFTNQDSDEIAKMIQIIPTKMLEEHEPEQPKLNDEHSLFSRIRTNLGIGYFDFCSEAEKEHQEWETFYKFLFENLDEINKRGIKRLKRETNGQKLSDIII